MARPRRENESFEEYKDNLFIEQCSEDVSRGRGVTKHRLSRLQDIQRKRKGVQDAASKKEVETR